MSSFACPVARIRLFAHPNADALEIAQAAGLDYQFVVPKGHFRQDEHFCYIPEGAVLPEPIIASMGLQGKLAGAQKNRVKAIKLRGVISQGLAWKFYLGEPAWPLGHDLAEHLGITKYEPAPPKEMQGHVRSVPSGPAAPGAGFWRSYDVENLKNHANALLHGEPVQITEKLHGSCTIVGVIGGEDVVSSKGMAKRGFVLEPEQGNTYWRIARQLDLHAKLRAVMDLYQAPKALLFGEVLGVQDLMYGLAPGDLDYRAFDLYLDYGCDCAGDQRFRFLDAPTFRVACEKVGIPAVPLLYEGPWHWAALEGLLYGPSTLAGHLREGVVIKPLRERQAPGLGRVALKWVSPDYLLRKSGTEYE